MRKLNLSDAFKVSRIIKEAGIKNEVSTLAAKFLDKKNVNLNEVGLEFFLTLITAAANSKVENQIYELIADVKKITPEEVKTLDFDEIKEFILAVVEMNNLKVFFGYVSKLM